MNVFEVDAKYALQVYKRFNVVIERGKGPFVWDSEGKKYLDFVAGVAVNNVGHCHPEVVKAVREQAGVLMQPSNWFYNKKEAELHEKLARVTPKALEQSFFSNSGAEAVETAFKLARKATGKKEVIAMEKGFHGRTMGVLTLTWKEKYKKMFEPLVPGVKRVPFDDSNAVAEAMGPDTAAVVVEPIQGEGGVVVPKKGYLKEVRKICDEKDVLLITDEIQTGFGRTGRMFACELEGVTPDIMCLAKGLGGGFPIGATIATEEVGKKFSPGDHGSTFGGNPLACAAALASINAIEKEGMAKNAEEVGSGMKKELEKAGVSARGKGLLLGVEVKGSERNVCEALIKEGVLASCPTEGIVRFTPPLNISKEHASKAVAALLKTLEAGK